MNLGETIYRLRTQRGMSQGDLAEAWTSPVNPSPSGRITVPRRS